MRFKQNGNKADTVAIVVKNSLSTKTIPLGAPVFFVFNGTDDGIAVTDGNGAAAAGSNCLAGVLVSPPAGLAAGNYGEAQAFGFCQQVRLVRQTRAATTDAYASTAAVSVGDILQVNTVTNIDGFNDVGAGVTNTVYPYAKAAQTLASLVSQASNGYTGAASSQTAVTATLKAFLTII